MPPAIVSSPRAPSAQRQIQVARRLARVPQHPRARPRRGAAARVSEMVLEFVKPILEQAGNNHTAARGAMNVAILLWNGLVDVLSWTMMISRRSVLIASLTLAAVAQAMVIVVSPTGSPQNAGTERSPLDIGTAHLKARALSGKEPVTVSLLGGVYELEQPLEFTAADSGTKDAPVLWCAAPGAAVTLSAGRTLRPDWKPYRDGILVTDLPADIAPFDQLFADGIRQVLARFPNFDATAPYYDGTSADATSKERVAKWSHPEGGFMHALHAGRWGDFHYVITGKNADYSLKLEGGTQNNRPEDGPSKTDRFVENIFEELDAPGEWFFDAKTRKLYFFPPDGLDVSKAVFTVPQGETVLRFKGDPGRPVKFVGVRGVAIRDTLRTFMKVAEPLLRSDWRIHRGGAAYFNNAEDCFVSDSDFDGVGGNAVFFDGYNRRDNVSGILIREAGASGVCVVGSSDAVRSPVFNYNETYDPAKADMTPGPKSENYPQDITIDDCLITRTGRVEKQTAGVTIDIASRVRVTHCTIADVPRAGINIGEGAFGGHLLEGNDVFDTVKETGDHGSFNSWGRDRYWNPNTGATSKFVNEKPETKFLDVVGTNVIRGNRFRYDKAYGWDIDLDDGSSNYLIENNLCLNRGLKFREGWGRVARNNVLVGNTFHPHVWYQRSGDIFEHNIVFRPYEPIGMPKVWGEKIDGNFLHVPGGMTGPAFALQKVGGQDANSLTGDAMFDDPANGDYTVKAGSPALQAGFVNFPMTGYGVTSARLKALAPRVSFATETGAKDRSRPDDIVALLGAKVKNLNGIGEVSATGMGEEKGVFVSALPTDSALAKLGVRERDVILGWNGKRTDTLAALRKAVSTEPSPSSVNLWRDQGPMTLKTAK